MSKKPNPALPAPKSFEDALRELETILAQIEGGQIGLEESLIKHERGSFLIQHCRDVLSAAEKQIEGIPKPERAAADAGDDADEFPVL